jgi:hypothetical protein
MPDEEIEELVNGYYDAGFALLVATKQRVLLVDKKPLNYLTVEDLRFDMISEFDYSHRIIGAHVSISSGNKNLSFTSLNQKRLRSLLTFVQSHMAEMKKTVHNQQETQQQHLEQMNQQLREYLETAQQAAALQQTQAQTATASYSAGPELSPRYGYMLPKPVAAPSELRDRDSFERAAAASIDLPEQEEFLPEQPQSAIRKMVVTPQQIGLAAARRVVPIVSAVKNTESQYTASGAQSA